ncbi:MAG: DUF393 domain-containing protein [Planctomycetales bacterium]|nr:DUF393 domain-containing protein [Planctomycetales bacterium]
MPSTTTPSQRHLPGPSERPGADIVIYDGHCRFCTHGVRQLHALDWGHRLAYMSLHDADVPRRWPHLTHEQLMRHMYVATSPSTKSPTGKQYAGADAFRYLTRRLPLLWPLMPLMHIPGTMALWRWLYDLIARNRYRVMGKTSCDNGACDIHSRH